MDEHRPTPPARLKQAGLISLSLTPLLLALLGTSAVPQGRPVSGTKVLPPLAFRQYSVNFHEVAPTANLTAPFAFWNRSDKTIQIVRLEPSCGCLAPRLLGGRKEYAPGRQGLFEVQVETAREAPGPHTYSIKVHYTVDQQPYEELVTFRCKIPERSVTVTPPELYFYQLSDAPLSSEVRIEDHRGKHLKVVEAVSTSPYLTMNVGDQEELGDDKSATPIQVAVSSQLPAGSTTTIVAIRTDDEDFPLIRVPVFLQGKPTGPRHSSGVTPTSYQMEKQAGHAETAIMPEVK